MTVLVGLAAGFAVWLLLERGGPRRRRAGEHRRPASRLRLLARVLAVRPPPRDPGRLVEVFAQLAAVVGAGLDLPTALTRISQTTPDPALAQALSRAGQAMAAGNPVGPALAADRRLASLAAVLDLVDGAGAPAGPTLARLAQAAADEEEARLAVATALAAPRATGRLLAALPVLGIGLGYLVGADPVHTLLATGAGRLSLTVGVACALAGLIWTSRLVRAAIRA